TVAYDYFENNREQTEISIVDNEGKFLGLMTRNNVMHAFGGRYGFTLHQRHCVIDLAKQETLVVHRDFTIENVSRLAMERKANELYDAVVVLDHGRYFGIVTIKDLLEATISIAIERATDSNPLTSLPGNRTIDQKIHELIGSKEYFAIMYLDLDNFKAYNDTYGFPNGDRMIVALAEAIKKVYKVDSFLGHVGGDDFVIITKTPDIQERAERIITFFKKQLKSLYNEADWERGYITSKNRAGAVENFPIASVSIAVVTNQNYFYNQMALLNNQIVRAKKKAKHIEGNSICVM
ncbi:MAG: GGDEF domain-containing protein, partial [Eubacteriales bacterium]|nr:GGDEF domain-containing protein [Eubacteriales bacterium]